MERIILKGVKSLDESKTQSRCPPDKYCELFCIKRNVRQKKEERKRLTT